MFCVNLFMNICIGIKLGVRCYPNFLKKFLVCDIDLIQMVALEHLNQFTVHSWSRVFWSELLIRFKFVYCKI